MSNLGERRKRSITDCQSEDAPAEDAPEAEQGLSAGTQTVNEDSSKSKPFVPKPKTANHKKEASESNQKTEARPKRQTTVQESVKNFLPSHWKQVDMNNLERKIPAASVKLAECDKEGKTKYLYLYSGDDPKEFLEGHARLYFVQNTLHGKLSKLSNQKLAQRGYHNSRKLLAEKYDVTPSPRSKRVRLQPDLMKRQQSTKRADKQCLLTFTKRYLD